ncbi:biotin--[acetyl-CoA-carboxylase] ligase [Lipingzhangella sp. LS1_29]|uniref:biotin--[biotin carboxyl-carrier protein] ligase n=1 Tax=Lipingzhangella rawalii TaxID=2055835 RepID=A0ABU2H538_9ACTN|nr:biotin--[acetyl-CoA-carboxylase] ligase [Lipingzhangella rawalii]MDS1270396.1 biotin--[acetyl-CoA-carboxylase] ligase [Lipingzhangella rawalii]
MDDAQEPDGPARPPLDLEQLRTRLLHPGGLWRDLSLTAESASTNTELLEAARAGAPTGTVLVTEHQTRGRGRRDRAFHTPARAALTLSLLLRPQVPPARLGWLPLLTGVAVVRAVQAQTSVASELKWPNDVLAEDGGAWRKLAGILTEAVTTVDGTGIVVGTGLNVSQRRSELPAAEATSLTEAGTQPVDRQELLCAILDEFAGQYRNWNELRGDAVACGLADSYRQRCRTLGMEVRAHLPGGATVSGTATDIDPAGCLVIRTPQGNSTPLSAGDVVHVRPTTMGH